MSPLQVRIICIFVAACLLYQHDRNSGGQNSGGPAPPVREAGAIAAGGFSGRPVFIPDGDTFHLDGGQKVRLWGIDAPERQTASGRRARDVLVRMINGRTVSCRRVTVDKYRRIVARCATRRVPDIAKAMVESGFAREYRRFSNGYYRQAEAAARARGAGIWSGQ